MVGKSLVVGAFAFIFVVAQVGATADYKEKPTFTGQWDVPHTSTSDLMLLIDATDDDEVHVLNYTDQTFFEYEDDAELEDSWEDFDAVTFTSPRNLFVDHRENIFVLEAGTVNKLHRISKHYFEENGPEPASSGDDDDEDEEDEDEYEDDEYEDDDEDDGLADYLSWEVVEGVDVAATPAYAFVVTSSQLISIELATGTKKTVELSGNVAVATGRLGNVYVLTENGSVLKKYNPSLEKTWSRSLGQAANDIDVDRHGNIYVGRKDGYLKQYNRDFGLIQAFKLPGEVEPSQVTVSHDGDLFVAAKNSKTLYHYDFPDIPEPKKTNKGIYRFWSKIYKGHFYTSSFEEAMAVSDGDENWEYERVAYKFIPSSDSNAAPVYRFWSENYRHHFYTSSKAEKDYIEANDDNWSYEGEVYNVYATEQPGSSPIYRFWSETYQGHFYTSSKAEKEYIEANDSNWSYEGVAWWVIED